MPIALSSLENETVMPNRENLVKVGKSLVKVGKSGKSYNLFLPNACMFSL